MSIYVMAALVTLAPVSLALVFLYRTLASRLSPDESMDRLMVLSPEKYRPMERLLRGDDFRFLAGQPGFSPRMGRRFRSERRKIFRCYLRNLSNDFGKVSAACQFLIVHSVEDNRELVAGVMRQRVLFSLAMLAVEGRLLLYAAGIGTVDVRALVESLETMQAQIQMLLAPPQSAAAAI